ncbi:MAG TPA: RnfABCDGE type electron transport complex subunit D [Bacillota bacterium]|nr:RnfABCDGE type electron transport complex subunit D [Bacillota bacterium]HOK68241.1 RnfABCDGE type electron transport complex subunit D [Bacillota bacterium]HPP84456.1 RnfABCDGE type electron transport complex subunit D [Bacillota bacterium]
MHNAPFIHTEKTYRAIMVDVLIALAPALVWSVFVFGARAITIACLTVVFCVLFEYLARLIRNKFDFLKALNEATDLSIVVTGLLAAFMLPVAIPLYLTVVAALFAVGVKQAFGGTGKNIVNPAVFSALTVKLLFPSATSVFTQPYAYFNAFAPVLDGRLVEAYRVFSPFQMLQKMDHVYEEGYADLFFGNSAGNIGEIAVLFILLGGGYLAYRRIINPRCGLAYLAVVFLLTFFFPGADSETIYFTLTELMSGGVVLLAVFACGDFTTTPKQDIGKLIFGAGCGILTVLIRYAYKSIDGAYVAVLIMNLMTPVIDRYTRKVPYGMLRRK